VAPTSSTPPISTVASALWMQELIANVRQPGGIYRLVHAPSGSARTRLRHRHWYDNACPSNACGRSAFPGHPAFSTRFQAISPTIVPRNWSSWWSLVSGCKAADSAWLLFVGGGLLVEHQAEPAASPRWDRLLDVNGDGLRCRDGAADHLFDTRVNVARKVQRGAVQKCSARCVIPFIGSASLAA
jgi:hypothetical protein